MKPLERKSQRYIMYLFALLHIPLTAVKLLVVSVIVLDEYCTKRIMKFIRDVEEEESN